MNRRSWLCLGIGTEVFHFAFIISVLILGKLWMPPNLVNLALTITVMGQIIFLWCPLSVFSGYCFRKANSTTMVLPSLSLYLYKRFGRFVGMPIFIVLITISTLVGMARW